MKISKSVLQAIVAGVTLSAGAISCDTVKQDISTIHFNTCKENCDMDHSKEVENPNASIPYNCPACGMG